jgi:micrococcal nuclease
MIGGLLAGDCVTVLGKNSAADWAKVSFEDVIGWVSVAYLSIEGDLQNASVVSEEPDGQNHTTASPSSAPKPPTTPIPTSAPLPSSGFACVPKNTQRKTGQVVSVTDGDTIRVRIDGWNYPVRYIGIDTPEMDGYFGAEARSQNYRLVAGRKVTLVKDVSYTDQYGRLLRYVFVGDTFVNYELAQSGYAQAATYPPDVACSALFKSAASDARYADRGLWRPTTTPYPTAAAQQAGSSGNCHPSYPAVCIPPPPPDLDCKDVPFRRFSVVGSDPHRFDGDHDGVGCEW